MSVCLIRHTLHDTLRGKPKYFSQASQNIFENRLQQNEFHTHGNNCNSKAQMLSLY